MKRITALCIATLLIASSAFASDTALKENSDAMMKKCDSNGDGKLSKDEYTKSKMEAFSEYDKDSDGVLSKEEHEKMVVDLHEKLMGKKHA